MCGICGFYGLTDSARGPALLNSMAASIRHRGPDATGTWLNTAGSVGLATTRLAVIDLAGGSQPMTSPDGGHVVAFNGEIYNFRALRKELESLGHGFSTNSDTEVVLNAFRQWGPECLSRLRGMFGLAVFDTRNETLFLARDKTGIKPLYYHCGPSGFYFGSELKAVLRDTDIPRQINHAALADYLVLGYPLEPSTLFRHCSELSPGTWLQVSRSGVKTERYWEWRRRPATNGCRNLDHIEEVLRETVGEHLCADVEVGAFLSGGIDSSLLVHLIRTHFNKQVRTFTVKFGDETYDESPDAEIVARHLGTDHQVIEVPNGAVDFGMVEKVLDQFDQPFSDSSAIPTYILCREVRKHLKVIIAGDGGDEMFGGYPRFRHAQVARTLGLGPRWMLRGVESVSSGLGGLLPSQTRQIRKLLRASRLRGGDRLLALGAYVSLEELRSMLSPALLQVLGGYRPEFAASREHTGGADLVDATVAAVLPGDYLRKVDVMSSAHGLEVRVPLLGDQVLDLAAQLPDEMKYSWWENKIALRALAARHLPQRISKKKKQGFGIPVDSWLGRAGRSAVAELLTAPDARVREYVAPAYLEQLTNGFVTGEWNRALWSRDALYQRVYTLWSLERWLQTWRPAN